LESIAPTPEASRIIALDVLRGFALFGILLLNILGFGLPGAAYFNPVVDGATSGWNFYTWASVDVLFEGSMRCLFSILFGAGVVLFTTGDNAKGAAIYYRRNFWLLILGLVNVMVLLWEGDILVTYALSGAMLFLVRHKSPRWLIAASMVLIALMSVQYLVMSYGLNELRDQARSAISLSQSDSEANKAVQEWQELNQEFSPDAAAIDIELASRRESYGSAWHLVMKKVPDLYLFQLPVIMLLDALAMMLLGMALFKADVLSAGRSHSFYIKLLVIGFTMGLSINLYEVIRSVSSNFDLLVTFSFTRPTYQLGRLGMAAGYLGMVMIICQSGYLPWLTRKLAAVGRMALSSYLAHSLICLFIFTGAGFGLVGQMERWMLYVVVLAIWVFQIIFSDWWLSMYRFGPVEWVWRALTYGNWPQMKRSFV